jgi:hypothetical protein
MDFNFIPKCKMCGERHCPEFADAPKPEAARAPAAVETIATVEAPRPVAVPQNEGRARAKPVEALTDAEILAEYVRRGLGSAFDRKSYQRDYMRDYMRKRRMTA